MELMIRRRAMLRTKAAAILTALALAGVALTPAAAAQIVANAKRCIALTAGGFGTGDKATGSPLERAASTLDMEPLFDGVGACRAAAAAFPKNRRLSAGAAHATRLFNLVLYGTDNADKQPDALFKMALSYAATLKKPDAQKRNVSMIFFFLGSAYEYGIGTTANKAEAKAAYAKAAKAGNRIAARELARISKSGGH